MGETGMAPDETGTGVGEAGSAVGATGMAVEDKGWLTSVAGRSAAAGLAVLVVGVAASYALPDRLFALGQAVAWLVTALGLTILIGLSGQLSLGQAGFMAAGAYATALTQNALYDAGFTVAPPTGASGRFAAAAAPTAAGWTLLVALLVGGAGAAAAGALLGLAAVRMRGAYLAGVTLAFGLIVTPVAALVDALGGEQGLRVHVPRAPDAIGSAVGEGRFRVWVALVAAALVLAVLTAVVRGPWARDLCAARDDEAAAALVGIPVARVRLVAFVVSAATAGLGGGLYVYLAGTVLPGYFGLTTSLFLPVAVVLGGVGRLVGAVWGTLFVVAVPIVTTEVMSAVHASPALQARLSGNAPLALLGLCLIVVTLATPGGLAARLAGGPRRTRSGRRGGRAAAQAGTGASPPTRDVSE
ncbi:MAG: branched-chain amino acid ABC transporter permease [Micromonosporaceae bacterium]|nr:branched-chain amino acid ABC transporter permease [Micromonosporaceae bacterium]